jgi:hypothetical protein
MVGELNGIYRPNIDAHTLKGKYGSAIPDMAISDVGLNGKNGQSIPPM